MNDGQIIGEGEFKIVDKDEIEESNLQQDLIDLGLIDIKELSDSEKEKFEELKKIKRKGTIYE